MQHMLAKYGKLAEMHPEERKAIEILAQTKRFFPRGSDLIVSDLDDTDQLFIVESGRLFASQDLPEGKRAITRLYFAGDIIGTANVPFEIATQTITASSDTQVYYFPRNKLVEAFNQMPRIAAVFYTFAALENAILNDRLVSVGRTTGLARLASIILEIEARRNLLESTRLARFRLGLTQAEIGDAIGLTEVQVSRLFRQLTQEGLLRREGSEIEVLDLPALCKIGNFKDRYADINIEWYREEQMA